MKEIIKQLQQTMKILPGFQNNTNNEEGIKKTKSSVKWFSDNVSKAQTEEKSTKNIISEKTSRRFEFKKPGYVYMFRYIPPDKKDMPFYDEYPIILTLQFEGGKVIGINLHYLPPMIRVTMLLLLLKSLVSDNPNSKIRIDNILRSSLLRKYIFVLSEEFFFMGIKSKIRHVTPDEFVMLSFLPVHKFRKKQKTQIYSIVKSMVRKLK